MPPSNLAEWKDRSLEVPAPSASSVCGANFPRTCLIRYVALSGFLNLLAPYFSAASRPYFMPERPWGSPFRAFTLRPAGNPSQGPCLLAVAVSNLSVSYRRLQGFRQAQSRYHVRLVRTKVARALLGLSLFRAFTFFTRRPFRSNPSLNLPP